MKRKEKRRNSKLFYFYALKHTYSELGVSASDTRDTAGRERFHVFQVSRIYSYRCISFDYDVLLASAGVFVWQLASAHVCFLPAGHSGGSCGRPLPLSGRLVRGVQLAGRADR